VARTEIRITGLGGQGVVLAGYVIGRACAVQAGRHATMMQSFGPEARGSACSASLVICDSEVLYPYAQHLDVLVALSGEGYERYHHELKQDGVLIHEKDLVHPHLPPGRRVYAVPSTRIAESLGRPIVQNIVMLGFFAGVTRLVSPDEIREAVRLSVPAGTEELNLKAFDVGWAYFDAECGQSKGEEPQETIVTTENPAHR
jgi:2-oxoglutarate ferredoxin oxidoreductase subunit gamma